jgi:membrane associated rhomboid family serine protease
VLVPIFILFMFFEFPAWLVVLGWFALQVLRGFGSLAGGLGTDVAWFAHIGGFLGGLVLVRFGMIGRQRLDYERWHGWRAPPQQQYLRTPYRRPPPDRWMR